jgi:hypothetical protein
MAVDSHEDIDHGKRYPLVAIDERMVLNEAFQKRGGFVNGLKRTHLPARTALSRAAVREPFAAAGVGDREPIACSATSPRYGGASASFFPWLSRYETYSERAAMSI